ncbi:hypothetical protein LB450_03575 [Psychroflexus sp. CAK1W]|uniref:hypothetical protein n=1 Tax=Psychroflexus curvus TaxID=2873595 RepID=UPI001CCAFDE9|nr:hypothetical protein [Psychroflexus curvus]MBZ9627175.1 hypothetical protein [Psychroflexus curvus]
MLKSTGVFVFVFFISCIKTHAQDTLVLNTSVQKPSLLSAHVFGIFSSRLEGHFKSKPDQNSSLQFDYLSGNVWGQPVENYIPTSNTIKNLVTPYEWHRREFFVDRTDENFLSNTENFKIAYDGVIKGLKAKVYVPINSKNAIQVELRSFLLTRGRFPFTGLTGDDFIEAIHSNIAGGKDPFQRREFGLNQAEINYTDRQGRQLLIHENEGFFGGVKLDYYHYFENLLPYEMHFNIGLHSGINTSPFNKSIDLGFTANVFKNIAFRDNTYFQLGLSLGYLHLKTASLSDRNIEFATRPGFLNLESVFTYNILNSKQQTHSFGLDFYIQSAYHKPSEYDYSILFRNERADRSWHYSVTQLYLNNNYWTFFYAFTDKNSFRVYLQQDWLVNNTPDLQTGVSYVISFR